MANAINGPTPHEALPRSEWNGAAQAGQPERTAAALPAAEPAAAPVSRAGKAADAAAVEDAARRFEEFVRMVQRDLEFRVDEATGRTVIIVREAQGGAIVRQIPREDLLNAAAKLSEVSGLLFQAEA